MPNTKPAKTEGADSTSEQRCSKRYKAQIRILFSRSGITHWIGAETDNISAGGVFVRTRRHPLDVGTTVALHLKLEGWDRELLLSGVVTWVCDDVFSSNETAPRGMGIRFEEMDEESRRVLVDTLQRLEETRGQ